MAIILQRQEAVAGPQGSFPALTEKCLVKKMYPLPDMFDVIYPEPMEILGNLKYLKIFETFGKI